MGSAPEQSTGVREGGPCGRSEIETSSKSIFVADNAMQLGDLLGCPWPKLDLKAGRAAVAAPGSQERGRCGPSAQRAECPAKRVRGTLVRCLARRWLIVQCWEFWQTTTLLEADIHAGPARIT